MFPKPLEAPPPSGLRCLERPHLPVKNPGCSWWSLKTVVQGLHRTPLLPPFHGFSRLPANLPLDHTAPPPSLRPDLHRLSPVPLSPGVTPAFSRSEHLPCLATTFHFCDFFSAGLIAPCCSPLASHSGLPALSPSQLHWVDCRFLRPHSPASSVFLIPTPNPFAFSFLTPP